MMLWSTRQMATINAVTLLLCAVTFGNLGVEGKFFSIFDHDDNDNFTPRTNPYEQSKPVSAPVPVPKDDYFRPASRPVAQVPQMPTPYSKQYTPYQPPPLTSPNVKPTERPTPHPTLRPTPDPTPGTTTGVGSYPYQPGYKVPIPLPPTPNPTPDPTPKPTLRPTVSVIDEILV